MADYFEKYTKSEATNTKRVIATPDDFAKRNLFYAQEAGYLKSLKPHLSRRRGLESYLYILILSGSGTVVCAGRTYTVNAGDAAFIDCRDEYSHISSADNPWELMWVHFNGCLANVYHECFSEKKDCVFRPTDMHETALHIRRIIECEETRRQYSAFNVSADITWLLTDAITSGDSSGGGTGNSISLKLDSVIKYIDAHFTEKLTLDALSERFFISKYYMSRAFKDEYNMTIVNYILARRISFAKERLRYSDDSVEAIAAACGISDASYFNKVFRKAEGITASQYRRIWKGR